MPHIIFLSLKKIDSFDIKQGKSSRSNLILEYNHYDAQRNVLNIALVIYVFVCVYFARSKLSSLVRNRIQNAFQHLNYHFARFAVCLFAFGGVKSID